MQEFLGNWINQNCQATDSGLLCRRLDRDLEKVSLEEIDPEVFPLVLAIVLLVFAVAFSVFVGLVAVKAKKNLSIKNNDVDTEDLESAAAADHHQDHSNGEDRQKPASISRSSWVATQSMMRGLTKKTKADGPALLSWKEISCSYPSKNGSGDKDISVLSGSSGVMRRGELVAVMGPSGCGKSTLLDILSGRKSLGNVSGEMSILGHNVTDILGQGEAILKDVSAYIPQEVKFFPTQTPFEAVAFYADLALGRDARGDSVREDRINSILDKVDISIEARHRPIGGELAGGMVIRGLSGGQLKRLALACAIALKPSLMFIDEITSGLDSENCITVIRTLKGICSGMGVAAAVVIHQPSGDVFKCFDRLVLLAKGRPMFSDKISNLPDLYDEVYEEPIPEDHVLPQDLLRKAASLHGPAILDEEAPVLESTTAEGAARKAVGQAPTLLWQLRTLLLRNLTNHYIRNITNVAARLGTYSVIALFNGLVFWQVAAPDGNLSLSEQAASAAFGAYFSMAVACYLLPFSQISVVFYDKKVFASEVAMGLYPPWIFSVVQFLLETWVLTVASILMACFVIPMVGFWNPAMSKLGSFMTSLSVFCVAGVTGNGILLVSSVTTSSQDLAFAMGTGIATVSMVLSGGYVPFPYMQKWIAWLQWISPVKYTLQAWNIGLTVGTETELLVEMLEFDRPGTVSANIGCSLVFFFACTLITMYVLAKHREVR